jgi:hypothetical protein
MVDLPCFNEGMESIALRAAQGGNGAAGSPLEEEKEYQLYEIIADICGRFRGGGTGLSGFAA